MVKVVFSFDVPVEMQADYFKAVKETIKPYWESHGCQSYDVWQADGENAFIKEMFFPDVDSMQTTMNYHNVNAEAMSVVELFKTFGRNITRKIYMKAI